MSLPIPQELVGTTQALFYEFRHQTTSTVKPPYTLKEHDWEGSVSMYQLYMQYDTEYEAAIAILGSWSHWNKLCERSWFTKHKDKWDAEKQVKIKAMAEQQLIRAAEEGNVPAARYLHEGKKPQPARKRGRPTNHEKPARDTSEELERMSSRLRLVEGKKK